MKPEYITSAPGVYNFTYSDQIVNWAAENGIAMIGHTLIWHGQSAKWLNKNLDESVVTRAQAKKNMEAFIKEYVGRYSGKIHSWDVINEAFIDSDENKPYSGKWREYLRRATDNPKAVGHWYLAYENGADFAAGESGADYFFDAFYFARKYDPNAILYFNEYNEEFPHKRHAIADMVNDINAQWRAHPEYDNRLLIGGIGMQSHHNHIHTDVDRIRIALDLFAKTGAKISITEMDFTFGSSTAPAAPLTADEEKRQAEMYVKLFKTYLDYADHIERVTFWGKNDKQSWRAWGSPLFFDVDCQAKESFEKVIKLV
jgi:GH35 family endo-1,4-beta-xylanase